MPVFTVPLCESNDCHNPAGPGGGRFCSGLPGGRVLTPTRGAGLLSYSVRFAHGSVELTEHPDFPQHLLVQNAWVNPDMRGQGWGKRMYRDAANYARHLGYRGIVSTPAERSPDATRMWRSLKGRRHVRGRYYLEP